MIDARKEKLDELYNVCNKCTNCKLSQSRKNIAFGRGSLEPRIMFIGEGPGEQEDIEGKPFVGKAGKLLDQVILALEIAKKDYYIANIVKCRPPGNRNPEPDEGKQCIVYLREQVKILKPQILVCLGGVAMEHIYNSETKITKVRGIEIREKGFIILPTFHPAAILRDNRKKNDFWQDMLKIRDLLND